MKISQSKLSSRSGTSRPFHVPTVPPPRYFQASKQYFHLIIFILVKTMTPSPILRRQMFPRIFLELHRGKKVDDLQHTHTSFGGKCTSKCDGLSLHVLPFRGVLNSKQVPTCAVGGKTPSRDSEDTWFSVNADGNPGYEYNFYIQSAS